jgi:hypothetical protein
MTNLLRQRVMSELAARRLGSAAGILILASCTTLVLQALPDFGLAARVGLLSAVAAAWGVVGSQLPRVVRA